MEEKNHPHVGALGIQQGIYRRSPLFGHEVKATAGERRGWRASVFRADGAALLQNRSGCRSLTPHAMSDDVVGRI
jgi:hypothetical protein